MSRGAIKRGVTRVTKHPCERIGEFEFYSDPNNSQLIPTINQYLSSPNLQRVVPCDLRTQQESLAIKDLQSGYVSTYDLGSLVRTVILEKHPKVLGVFIRVFPLAFVNSKPDGSIANIQKNFKGQEANMRVILFRFKSQSLADRAYRDIDYNKRSIGGDYQLKTISTPYLAGETISLPPERQRAQSIDSRISYATNPPINIRPGNYNERSYNDTLDAVLAQRTNMPPRPASAIMYEEKPYYKPSLDQLNRTIALPRDDEVHHFSQPPVAQVPQKYPNRVISPPRRYSLEDFEQPMVRPISPIVYQEEVRRPAYSPVVTHEEPVFHRQQAKVQQPPRQTYQDNDRRYSPQPVIDPITLRSEQLRLNYNADTDTLHQDPKGSIFWYVAHEEFVG